MREINLIPESSPNLSGYTEWLPGIKIRNLMTNGQTAGEAGLVSDPKWRVLGWPDCSMVGFFALPLVAENPNLLVHLLPWPMDAKPVLATCPCLSLVSNGICSVDKFCTDDSKPCCPMMGGFGLRVGKDEDRLCCYHRTCGMIKGWPLISLTIFCSSLPLFLIRHQVFFCFSDCDLWSSNDPNVHLCNIFLELLCWCRKNKNEIEVVY